MSAFLRDPRLVFGCNSYLPVLLTLLYIQYAVLLQNLSDDSKSCLPSLFFASPKNEHEMLSLYREDIQVLKCLFTLSSNQNNISRFSNND